MTADLSRRQFFTEALPRGLAGLLRGALQARGDLADWAAAGTAPFSGGATSSSELVASLRELHRRSGVTGTRRLPDSTSAHC